MKEIIEKISIIENYNIDFNNYDGYEIKTNLRSIKLLIENEQDCCEEWGYLSTPDNYNDFIGAEIYSYSNNLVKNYNEDKYAQFINFLTSNGELIFTVYNLHNGYYSHGCFIIENDKIISNEYL